jgi:hypothetical protein
MIDPVASVYCMVECNGYDRKGTGDIQIENTSRGRGKAVFHGKIPPA